MARWPPRISIERPEYAFKVLEDFNLPKKREQRIYLNGTQSTVKLSQTP